MLKTLPILMIVLITYTAAYAQLELSPVNTGDCVAARISAKLTPFVNGLSRKYCREHNSDPAKVKKCIENSMSDPEFSFFTDRCSESDYYIGLNGQEVKLRRTSIKPGRPNDFIGMFTNGVVKVEITNPRLVGKTYWDGAPRNESNVESATYTVDVRVTKGSVTKIYKSATLTYGF